MRFRFKVIASNVPNGRQKRLYPRLIKNLDRGLAANCNEDTLFQTKIMPTSFIIGTGLPLVISPIYTEK